MLNNCGKAEEIQHRLYETHQPLLASEKYHIDLAAVRLLGKDIAHLCNTRTRQAVQGILARESDETGELKLLGDIVPGLINHRSAHALRLLSKLLQGLNDDTAA